MAIISTRAFAKHRFPFQAEQEKKAAIISADGDAEAAALMAKSFGEAGEGLVELRRIEAAEDISYRYATGVLFSPFNRMHHLYYNSPSIV